MVISFYNNDELLFLLLSGWCWCQRRLAKTAFIALIQTVVLHRAIITIFPGLAGGARKQQEHKAPVYLRI